MSISDQTMGKEKCHTGRKCIGSGLPPADPGKPIQLSVVLWRDSDPVHRRIPAFSNYFRYAGLLIYKLDKEYPKISKELAEREMNQA